MPALGLAPAGLPGIETPHLLVHEDLPSSSQAPPHPGTQDTPGLWQQVLNGGGNE